ncbi:MAG: SAM-dependent methyltransferase [Phycisphaerales bacterium]
MPDPSPTFVSRGGLKLRHALDKFALSVQGLTCADFGCSTGGFTDCLLQAGAARVYAVDTAYGELAWKLRNDPRVVVTERTNCLHAHPPEPVDLVVADAGWTPQRLLVPAALRWLRADGRMITLIKPHYELKDRGRDLPPKGILADAVAEQVTQQTVDSLPACGVRVEGLTRSPILGGAKARGNAEWLALLAKA